MNWSLRTVERLSGLGLNSLAKMFLDSESWFSQFIERRGGRNSLQCSLPLSRANVRPFILCSWSFLSSSLFHRRLSWDARSWPRSRSPAHWRSSFPAHVRKFSTTSIHDAKKFWGSTYLEAFTRIFQGRNTNQNPCPRWSAPRKRRRNRCRLRDSWALIWTVTHHSGSWQPRIPWWTSCGYWFRHRAWHDFFNVCLDHDKFFLLDREFDCGATPVGHTLTLIGMVPSFWVRTPPRFGPEGHLRRTFDPTGAV